MVFDLRLGAGKGTRSGPTALSPWLRSKMLVGGLHPTILVDDPDSSCGFLADPLAQADLAA